MTYGELKNYVVEALGEDVVSVDQLIAGVRAAFGDLIARGYREFKYILVSPKGQAKTFFEDIMAIQKEVEEVKPTFDNLGYGMITTDLPEDCLTILYIKIFIGNRSEVAVKLALNNSAIQSKQVETTYRSDFSRLEYEVPPLCIYYKKGKKLFLEYDITKFNDVAVNSVEIGYYRSLPFVSERLIRRDLGINSTAVLDIEEVEVPLPEDYANVLVNFMVWYVAMSNGRDQEQLTVLKNEYKYSVEDLLARKNREDQYDETTSFIKIEG